MQSDHQKNRTLVNEAVAAHFGRLVDLPVPESAIIRVPEGLILASPQLSGKLAGLYFGCDDVPGAFDLWTRGAPALQAIDNAEHTATAVAFDAFLWNVDRNNCGNLLLVPLGSGGRFRLLLIDHGHCLTGPTWTAATLGAAAGKPYQCRTHPLLRDGARSFLHRLQAVCNLVEQLTPDELRQAVIEIPAEWQINEDAANAIVAFLEQRRARVRQDAEAILC